MSQPWAHASQVPMGRHAYAVSTAAHLVGLLLNSLLLGIVVAKGEVALLIISIVVSAWDIFVFLQAWVM